MSRLSKLFSLITREPKVILKVTKRRLLRLKVRFGHLSVTLSNGWGAKKCVGNYCTLLAFIPMDFALRGLLSAIKRPSEVVEPSIPPSH
jgi:hypothetical protein